MKKEVIELVNKWLMKAERDFKTVKKLMGVGEIITDTACFHAQQSIEKYLKAFLIYHQIPFGRTHDLIFLVQKCKDIDKDFEKFNIPKVDKLTDYAVEVRYPNEFYIPTLEEARESYQIAKEIRDFVKGKLEGILE
jgi:HEPN domain-containing protein